MLLKWVEKLIADEDIITLQRKMQSRIPGEALWAIYGYAECMRTGGAKFPANKKQAYELFNQILNNKPIYFVPYYLKLYAELGIADCLRVGDNQFPADIKKAHTIYVRMQSQEQLPESIKCRVECGIADCLRTGGNGLEANRNKAYALFSDLLANASALPPRIKLRACMGKADCLFIGDEQLPHDRKEAFEIFKMVAKDLNPPSDIMPRILCRLADCIDIGAPTMPSRPDTALKLYKLVLEKNKLTEEFCERTQEKINQIEKYLERQNARKRKQVEEEKQVALSIDASEQPPPATPSAQKEEKDERSPEFGRAKPKRPRPDSPYPDSRLSPPSLNVDGSNLQQPKALENNELNIPLDNDGLSPELIPRRYLPPRPLAESIGPKNIQPAETTANRLATLAPKLNPPAQPVIMAAAVALPLKATATTHPKAPATVSVVAAADTRLTWYSAKRPTPSPSGSTKSKSPAKRSHIPPLQFVTVSSIGSSAPGQSPLLHTQNSPRPK